MTTFQYLLQPAAADALSKFYYPPVAAVSISYPKEAIRSECLIDGELKGFGQLHPRSQGVQTLGKYLNLLCKSGSSLHFKLPRDFLIITIQV